MEASPAAIAAYEAALPDDPRVERKQMFGVPCAFVNRQMFFGTFEDALIARVGPARVARLIAEGGLLAFTPMEGRTWGDYVRAPSDTAPEILRSLAAEALRWADKLPPKGKAPVAAKRAKRA